MALFNKKSKENTEVKVDERLQHIAFIMDGNGRWAKKRGMPREYGHTQGAKVFKEITEYCGDIGINTVTVYAFSTENWKRPKAEVDAIMKLFIDYIYEALNVMMKKDICIKFLGDKSPLPDKMKELMTEVEEGSKNNKKHLNIAINYGGKDEIVHAVNTAIAEGITEITEKDIEDRLYTKGQMMPDLIFRTAGEQRLSNFLMWQSAYSEFYFTDTLWPDLKPEHIDAAVENFYQRQRRYGGL
ncbi:MAG: di-trans,poly-cis-decaprenylcistransferase [Ruminococcaceae bacterium]|nr:di-trans,poly-cis-decaprenylcistransferase [Oscillospiraceae bacterium]